MKVVLGHVSGNRSLTVALRLFRRYIGSRNCISKLSSQVMYGETFLKNCLPLTTPSQKTFGR